MKLEFFVFLNDQSQAAASGAGRRGLKQLENHLVKKDLLMPKRCLLNFISHFLQTLSETGEGARSDKKCRFCARRQRYDLRGKNHCCKGTNNNFDIFA